MSAELQRRARAFLERAVPEAISYVPDSFAERFIATYAIEGLLQLDAELSELLGLVLVESRNAAESPLADVSEYFGESSAILEAIRKECMPGGGA